jgi:hypothetical protein
MKKRRLRTRVRFFGIVMRDKEWWQDLRGSTPLLAENDPPCPTCGAAAGEPCDPDYEFGDHDADRGIPR